MEALDPAGEWRHLSEHYREMSDTELLVLAVQKSELTEVAQQTLEQEISYRKLRVPPTETPEPPSPISPTDAPDDDSPYDEDRELVELRTVWSLSDALQLQTLLDRAGIPFFMGREKATGVDAVTSDFTSGVSVQVMRIGLPWTRQPMQNYTPADETGPKPDEEVAELPVRCPKCDSTEVIFGSLASEPPAKDDISTKFEWTCDFCGHEWEDDGIVKEE